MQQGSGNPGRVGPADDGPPAMLAYRVEDAAKALGISADSFERYVKPNVRCVRLGTIRIYPRRALEAFLDANAVSPDDELARRRGAA